MTLQDILDQLQAGEFRHLELGQTEDPSNLKEIVAHVNLGNLDLHKRFWLKQKDLLVKVYEDIYVYVLDKKFSTNSLPDIQIPNYIVDSTYNPFDNDILKIERIFDSTGHQQPLNDSNCPDETFLTPSYNTVQIPLTYQDTSFIVEYRASPEKISADCDPCLEIDLPDPFLPPILLYIGHRASRSINSDNNAESNNYFQQYELECRKIKDMGYEVVPQRTNVKLDQRGYV